MLTDFSAMSETTVKVLRLKHECGLPNARVAAALGIAQGSLANYLAAAATAGLTHSEAQALDDAALNARLHPQRYVHPQFAVPDFGQIHRELRRKGVTLPLLWEEYRAISTPCCLRFGRYSPPMNAG